MPNHTSVKQIGHSPNAVFNEPGLQVKYSRPLSVKIGCTSDLAVLVCMETTEKRVSYSEKSNGEKPTGYFWGPNRII